MTPENIAGPDQNRASPLAAMSEAEERKMAKAQLSDLLDQIDQTQAEAAKARALMDCLGDKARTVADWYAEDNLDDAQKALEGAHNWVEAYLAYFDKPDEPDEPKRDDSALIAALITLHGAAQRLRRPSVNVERIEMKLIELAEFFDITSEIFWEA
jgi:hypothetical protein